MMKPARYLPCWMCLLLLLCNSPSASSAQAYSVDGMIGQVNGRAIYTKDVFDEHLAETLAAWGRELPRTEFRKRAVARIAERLNSMVTDALIYGEAQRDLSDQERQGLTIAVTKQREQLLREYGQGSAAVAEAELIKQTGIGLDKTLENWRQAMVVQRYMYQKLRPKVNVTRKDIKRYYNDHEKEFNPPPTRTVRVIQTKTGEDSQRISDLLQQGKSFAEVASESINLFHPDTGGMMGAMAGDQLFADPQVNDAILALEPDQYAGPFTVGDRDWFVFLEKHDQSSGKSLMDVQTQIQKILFEQQLREQTERYRRKLFEQGGYDSIEEMTMNLVEIAEDRYAHAEP